MKRVFAILAMVLMFVSGMTISIDRHYCGGELASTKISVSGKVASCGMEKVQNHCPNQPFIDKNCCNDQLSCYRTGTKYLPEYFKFSYPSDSKKTTSVPECNAIFRSFSLAVNNKYGIPPGEKLKSAHDLSEICVYRL